MQALDIPQKIFVFHHWTKQTENDRIRIAFPSDLRSSVVVGVVVYSPFVDVVCVASYTMLSHALLIRGFCVGFPDFRMQDFFVTPFY